MAKSKNPFKINRQSWDQEKVMDYICERTMNTSLGLQDILSTAEHDMPSRSSVMAWLAKEDEAAQVLLDKYTRAKRAQAEYMAEEMLSIADDSTNDYMTVTRGDVDVEVLDKEHVQRSRLRIETRKWLMSKLMPKKYGDKIEHSGAIGTMALDNLTDQELDLRIAQLAKVLSDND